MAVADVVILNIARILDRTGDLKDTNKSIGFIMAFVHYQLSLNRLRCAENEFYVDSTPGTVCENRYISSLKVARGFASRGKSTKGWFFGFKLHGGSTSDGTLMRLRIRPHKGRGWNVPPLFLQHFGIFAPPR